MGTEDINEITAEIIHSALRIHSKLGPGLLESVYERVMARDLERKGLQVERQVSLTFEFEGMVFEGGLIADLVVGRAVVVEVKSVAKLSPVCWSQLLTYLRVLDYRVGLLLNFGEQHLRDGIKRVANGPVKTPSSVSPVTSA